MNKINVAMLSKWHVHSEGYAESFKKLENVNLSAVWDEDANRGREWAKTLDCEFIESLDELLARPDIDLVAVGTPTVMHKEVLCRAAKAKKAIFTEKVLACTNEEADEIAAAVKSANIPFFISYPFRMLPVVKLAKQLADDGAIGKITHLRIRDAHDGASAGWLPNTFYDESVCGGGAMMDLGAHPMYLSDYFLGLPKSVFSTFTQCYGKGVDDNCVTMMEYASGAIATSETAFVSSRCPFILEINGDQGHIMINDNFEGLHLSNKDGINQTILPEDNAKPESAPAFFVRLLTEDKPSPFDIDAAVRLTRLMDAAYRSYRQGIKITL